MLGTSQMPNMIIHPGSIKPEFLFKVLFTIVPMGRIQKFKNSMKVFEKIKGLRPSKAKSVQPFRSSGVLKRGVSSGTPLIRYSLGL